MKEVTGWWFTVNDCLPHGDGRKITVGKTHSVKGEIIPCRKGLHLSKRIIDALQYAEGTILYKVKGHGIIVPHGDPVDKYACSHRTYLDRIEAKDVLFKFARLCALDVIDLWDAPSVVVDFLKTGNQLFRSAARSAAKAAAWDARNAAWSAAWSAAWAARDARDARDAARAARDARDAARAARDAAIGKQNKRLHGMIARRLK